MCLQGTFTFENLANPIQYKKTLQDFFLDFLQRFLYG